MTRFLESLPDDAIDLTERVLGELRGNKGGHLDTLSSRQQRLYGDLASLTLAHVVSDPRAATLFGRLGPNEEAFGFNLAMVDGAVLRLHFYSQAGVSEVDEQAMADGPIDTNALGAPHNHWGDISAVAPVGSIVHHCLKEVEGDDYTAGSIQLVDAQNPNGGYKYSRSVFVPERLAGLEPISHTAVDAGDGYWMERSTVHVVHWPEPAITVFLNDFAGRNKSVIYQRGPVDGTLQKARLLDPAEKAQVWQEFTALAATAGYEASSGSATP